MDGSVGGSDGDVRVGCDALLLMRVGTGVGWLRCDVGGLGTSDGVLAAFGFGPLDTRMVAAVRLILAGPSSLTKYLSTSSSDIHDSDDLYFHNRNNYYHPCTP